MKKIFTLLFTVSLASAAFSQYPSYRQENGRGNDVAYNDNRERKEDNRFDDRHYNFDKREMDMKIADINREYDNRICEVKDNWFIGPYRKQRRIEELECRRKEDIDAVYARFNENCNQFNENGPKRHW